MRYTEAIGYLYQLAPRGIELGLERMERALALRDHPERGLPAVLIAGTNGKGSVATMIARVLQASGQRTGLFTSPHLHRFVERFQVAGRPVAEATLARKITALRPFLEAADTPPLTFFEAATLLAFELFRDARCDVMVLEVGLGGRLDSTNVVTPEVCVITSVARDHTDRLGEKISQIAREKAGILKPGVPAVCGVRDSDARAVVRRRARCVGAPLALIDRDFAAIEAARGHDVRVGERTYARLAVPLGGAFQRDNLACAVAALDALRVRFPIDDERAVRRGLARVSWTGRLELLADADCSAMPRQTACGQARARTARERGPLPKRVLCSHDARQGPRAHARHPTAGGDACVSPRRRPRARCPRAELARASAASARGPAARSPRRETRRQAGLVIACGSIYVRALVRAARTRLRADRPHLLAQARVLPPGQRESEQAGRAGSSQRCDAGDRRVGVRIAR